MGIKKGQALMELAVGLFALALIVSALSGFAVYISKSLKIQNAIRVGASSQEDEVRLSDFGAQYVFGRDTLKIRKKVHLPLTGVLK